MKKLILLVVTILISISFIYGQEIAGKWSGVLSVQGMKLRVVFNISNTQGGLISTMDSPDQGVKGIPVTTTSFENLALKIIINDANIEYEGVLVGGNIVVGVFKQSGHTFPMNLSRGDIEVKEPARPQEPHKPYPYYSEEVMFENKSAGITLAGTLTLPKNGGASPVVVLISGSGPQNRDEELFGHKPFLVLSDFLTKNGIAVLRYDDRGTASSTGDFTTATSADFATDVESAVAYLKTRKEIDKKSIGLIGHSEGGIIAPMVASKSKDVSFIVLLAGTGIKGDELLLLQQKLIGKAYGVSDDLLERGQMINRGAFDIVNESSSTEQLKADFTAYIRQILKENPDIKPGEMSEDEFVGQQIDQVTAPWMQFFIRYNPAVALERVKCPVLALNGEKDLQVPSEINLESIKGALLKGGNKRVTTIELPGLNHMFQECETGSPDEYAKIEQTFSPLALAEILKWIEEIL